jgi:hypothetical protein
LIGIGETPLRVRLDGHGDTLQPGTVLLAMKWGRVNMV